MRKVELKTPMKCYLYNVLNSKLSSLKIPCDLVTLTARINNEETSP